MAKISTVNEKYNTLCRNARYMPPIGGYGYFNDGANTLEGQALRPVGSYIPYEIDDIFKADNAALTEDGVIVANYIDGVYPVLNPLGISMDIAYRRWIAETSTTYQFINSTKTVRFTLASSDYPDPDLIQAGDIFLFGNASSGYSGFNEKGVPIKKVSTDATYLYLDLELYGALDPSDATYSNRPWQITLLRNGLSVPVDLYYFNGNQKLVDASKLTTIYATPMIASWVRWLDRNAIKFDAANLFNHPTGNNYQYLRVDVARPLQRLMITRGYAESNANEEEFAYGLYTIKNNLPQDEYYGLFNSHTFPTGYSFLQESTPLYFQDPQGNYLGDPLLLVYGFLKGSNTRDVSSTTYTLDQSILSKSKLCPEPQAEYTIRGGGLIAAMYAKTFLPTYDKVTGIDWQGYRNPRAGASNEPLASNTQLTKKINITNYQLFGSDGSSSSAGNVPIEDFRNYFLQTNTNPMEFGLNEFGFEFGNIQSQIPYLLYEYDGIEYLPEYTGYIRLVTPNNNDVEYQDGYAIEPKENSIAIYWLNEYGVWQSIIINGDWQLIDSISTPQIYEGRPPQQLVNTYNYTPFGQGYTLLRGDNLGLVRSGSGRGQVRRISIRGEALPNVYRYAWRDLCKASMLYIDLDIKRTLDQIATDTEVTFVPTMGYDAEQYGLIRNRLQAFIPEDVELIDNRPDTSFLPVLTAISAQIESEPVR